MAKDKLDEFLQGLEAPQCGCVETKKVEEEILSKDAKVFERLKDLDYKGDIDLKKMYGIAIIAVLGLWELFVIIFTFMQICPERRLSDAVLITLLTTATANILVLPTIVLKYLFPKR